MFSNALINKGNRKIAHHCVEQFVELRNVNHFFLVGQSVELHPNLRAEGIEIKQIPLRIVEQECPQTFLNFVFHRLKYRQQSGINDIHLALSQLLFALF